MARVLITLLIFSLSFAYEGFTEWWKNSKYFCVYGEYEDFSGKLRKIKPFCCIVHRVDVRKLKGYMVKKFGAKEGITVVASCRGFFQGVINYDGNSFTVSGNSAITKDTPVGVLNVINERRIYFEVCRGSASFNGCLDKPFGRGHIVKVK